MTEPAAEKNELRRTYRARAAQLPEAYKTAASAEITRALLGSGVFQAAGAVFVYMSTPSEPPTGALIEAALEAGKTVYVPKCISKTEMVPVPIRKDTVFSPGCFGIPEPADCKESTANVQIDLAVIPCISASPDGARLGHGAGYYDRFLAGRDMKKICLCFHALLASSLPTEPTDILMDAVITEKQIYEKK